MAEEAFYDWNNPGFNGKLPAVSAFETLGGRADCDIRHDGPFHSGYLEKRTIYRMLYYGVCGRYSI
jgi:hypothetical protein